MAIILMRISVVLAASEGGLKIELTNAAGGYDEYTLGSCPINSANPITCSGQDTSLTHAWFSTSPCCCSVSAAADINNEWSADFVVGDVEITAIKFLGNNAYPVESDSIKKWVYESG